MNTSKWGVWASLAFVTTVFRVQADNVTNELFRRLQWDSPEQHIKAYMEDKRLSAEDVSEILKAIVRAGYVKVPSDAELATNPGLGNRIGEVFAARDRAMSVMGSLRLPNSQDFLIQVDSRTDGAGRIDVGRSIIRIGGPNALAFTDAVLATNRVSKHEQQYLCREIWLNAAGYYDGGTSNESSALFREYIVSTPFREMKIKGARFADGEESRSYEQYRLSAGREACLRLVVEKGLDKDGYFAGQLAGLLAERHVKESGGLSITNEGGYVTNIPRPSVAPASLGTTEEVGLPSLPPMTKGTETAPGKTPITASPPRVSFRVWIGLGCAASIVALLAALTVRRRL